VDSETPLNLKHLLLLLQLVLLPLRRLPLSGLLVSL
jgi:hypothetical protein